MINLRTINQQNLDLTEFNLGDYFHSHYPILADSSRVFTDTSSRAVYEIAKKVEIEVTNKELRQRSEMAREIFNDIHKNNKNMVMDLFTILSYLAKLDKKNFKKIIAIKEYKNVIGWKAPFYYLINSFLNKDISEDLLRMTENYIDELAEILLNKYNEFGEIGKQMYMIVTDMVREVKDLRRQDINPEIIIRVFGCAYSLGLAINPCPMDYPKRIVSVLGLMGAISTFSRPEPQTLALAEILLMGGANVLYVSMRYAKDDEDNMHEVGYIEWKEDKKEYQLLIFGVDDFADNDKSIHINLLYPYFEHEKIIIISDAGTDFLIWGSNFKGSDKNLVYIMIGDKHYNCRIDKRFKKVGDSLGYIERKISTWPSSIKD